MKVIITCNLGASTSILQMKLQEEAKKRNYEIEIEAVPYTNLKPLVDSTDILLCSPQVRFAFNEIEAMMKGKPCVQLSIQDFGLMNADSIMNQIEPYLKK